MPPYNSASHLTGDVLLSVWEHSGLPEKQLWKKRYSGELTYNAFHGRIWRAKHGIVSRPELFQHDLGEPLHLNGDWMIIGDAQLPTTDYDFAILPAVIAEYHLSRPRQLLIVGDLINADAFSKYEDEIGTPTFRQEIKAAKQLISEWRTVFDRVIWLAGNHERRVSGKTSAALLMADLAMIIDTSVETSDYDRAVIHTPTGDWLAAHGSNYSVNQLSVLDWLVWKYRMNVIGHHQHHCAKGWDRFKHNVVVDNGGLFNQWHMSYVQMNTSKSPNMMQGFTMLRGGYPYVFSREPFTNWADWLPESQLRKVNRKSARNKKAS